MKGDRANLLIRLNEALRFMERHAVEDTCISLTYNELWAAAGALRMAEGMDENREVKVWECGSIL